MPRRIRRENTEGQDSFLDILFNVIGILVLIVAFAALASTSTSQVQKVFMGIKGESEKKMMNIICAENRCTQLDQEDQQLMENNFAIRLEGRKQLLSPLVGAEGWISLEAISSKGALEKYFVLNPSEEYDISLLVYQDSFQVAARVESIGRARGYGFRHVFFENGEAISIERRRVYVN